MTLNLISMKATDRDDVEVDIVEAESKQRSIDFAFNEIAIDEDYYKICQFEWAWATTIKKNGMAQPSMFEIISGLKRLFN